MRPALLSAWSAPVTPTPREQPMPLTPEQVEEFARAMCAQFITGDPRDPWLDTKQDDGTPTWQGAVPLIQRIAQAAAQAENERCAKLAESTASEWGGAVPNGATERIAAALRVSREQGER